MSSETILSDHEAEFVAVHAVAHRDRQEIASYLFQRLRPEHFQHKLPRKIFDRISTIYRSRGTLLNWASILRDRSFTESERGLIETNEPHESEEIRNKEDADEVFSLLDKLRGFRTLNDIMLEVSTRISDGEDVPVSELASSLINAAQDAQSINTDLKLFHFGRGNNTADLMQEIMVEKRPSLIPTGFSEFDSRTGGLPENGLWIIAAPTGSGKSVTALQTAVNMHRGVNTDVCYISLEMFQQQLMRRLMANLSGVPLSAIDKKTWNDDQRRAVVQACRKFVMAAKKANTRFTFLPSSEDITITQLLAKVQPLNYDVVVIDYIGLLKGTDGDRQAQALAGVAREAKLWSNRNNCLVILLAQLDADSEKLRYSRGILEHADGAWIWTLPKDKKTKGDKEKEAVLGGPIEIPSMRIKQIKGRDQPIFSWRVKYNFESMQVGDDVVEPEPFELEDVSDDNSIGKRGSREGRRARRKLGDEPKKDLPATGVRTPHRI